MIVVLTETTGISYENISISPTKNFHTLAFDRIDASMPSW